MVELKKYISEEEMNSHNKKDDLWISIQGKIYNVTNWANHHPGGVTPLLNLAGQDVTDAFLALHPSSAWKYLDQFFTGYHLKDYNVSETSKDYRKLVSEFTKLGIQHVQFCLNHFSSNHYVGPPSGSDWFEKQTSGTLDIDCPPWMDWFF
ncbi:Delta(8)-fatty-acid desaturase, partial [Bienertia sinuspersici]